MVQYMQFLLSTLSSREDEGQGMVEYGLIIALVALVVIGALTAMGGAVETQFNSIVSAL